MWIDVTFFSAAAPLRDTLVSSALHATIPQRRSALGIVSSPSSLAREIREKLEGQPAERRISRPAQEED
jgi:hypothetical protein